MVAEDGKKAAEIPRSSRGMTEKSGRKEVGEITRMEPGNDRNRKRGYGEF